MFANVWVSRILRADWRKLLPATALLCMMALPAAAQTPCCSIAQIDARTGTVTAKINATGRVFRFHVNQTTALRIGQPVYANLTTKQVSLDGKSACCKIVDAPPLAGPAERSTALPAGTGSSANAPEGGSAPSAGCTVAANCPASVGCPVGAAACATSVPISSAVCTTACSAAAKCSAGYTQVATNSCGPTSSRATCRPACPAVSNGQPLSCNVGYYGANCLSCPTANSKVCSGQGVCGDGMSGNGLCTCNEGFVGYACQYSNAVTCSGHGTVSSSGMCTCSAGYSGTACNVRN